MYRIGIICAGDQELEPFLKYIENIKVSQKAMLKFYEGTIGDIEVVALFCGVCKVNAALATQILIDTYNVNTIINSGTAGGMDEHIEIFDTIISECVAYHDVAEDILTEFHPYLESIYFRSDDRLLHITKKIMKTSEHNILIGKSVTGEQFIKDCERQYINSKFAPLSVDMETGSIAHVCYVNQIPFIAIRTITDTASHSGTENFEMNCDRASEIACEVTIELLKEM